MKPCNTRTEAELLEWAAGLIQREQQAATFGIVQIHMEGGRIVHARVERNERPPEGASNARNA